MVSQKEIGLQGQKNMAAVSRTYGTLIDMLLLVTDILRLRRRVNGNVYRLVRLSAAKRVYLARME